jgi:serine/threonine protein kinase
MGLVYIAKREKDQKLYALKTLKRWDQEKEGLIKEAILFRNESLVWITLGKHKNIVQAFWFDLDEHYRPFLIMEYVEGPAHGVNLRQYLKSSERLDTALGVRFVLETLNGLIYAKKTINAELNIPFIHKDIKPENLLITKNSILKVTDFGLVMGRGGTPLYKAPEQWEREEVEEKTDVYALGCVLYELTGRYPPFLGTSSELKNRHLYEKPAPLIKCPSDLNELVIQCLSKSPDERPDFFELQNTLQGIYERLTGNYFVLKEEPEPLSAEDLNARGSGFDQLGYHERAIECYNNAIALDPKDQRFYLNRANARVSMKMEELAEAVEDYKMALRLDPGSLEAHLGLGNLFAQKGDFEEALKYYGEVERLFPSEPMVSVCLGNVYAKQEFYSKAEAHFKKVLSIRPELAEAHLGLGNVYLCQKNYQEAEENYKKAINLNPLYANAYLNLARLYQVMGKFEERDKAIEIVSHLMPLMRDNFKDT